MSRWLAPFFGFVTGILLLACGSDSEAGAQDTPEPLPTPVRARSISYSLQTSCKLKEYGAEITLSYASTAQDGQLTRVRLLRDGRVEQDSGAIVETEWRDTVVLQVPGGARHVFQVVAESDSLRSESTRSIVRCPAPLPGQRA